MERGSNPSFATRVEPYGMAAVAAAATIIAGGGCVAVPTETVYGLAADSRSAAGVAAIYRAKGRPDFNPLIVHVADAAMAQTLVAWSDAAERLAAHFWPGPLTLVLPLLADAPVAEAVAAGLPTLAVRAPAHPAMQALIAAVGRPLAAPSANASGAISPTTAGHVLATLRGRIPMVIDAGPCAAGIESAIVAVGRAGLRLLRPGPIDPARLEDASGLPVMRAEHGDAIAAPGMLASHYAPHTPLFLNVATAVPGQFLIGFGGVAGDATLSASGDLAEAAARLYALLHQADASGAERIAVAPISGGALADAINDRLARAAAPRDGTEGQDPKS